MSLTSPKGLFIAIEGGEGAGKTTLLQLLRPQLPPEREVVVVREPGATLLGEKLRQLLLHADEKVACGAKAELLLFLAARAQLIEEKIAPALGRGAIVLADRYNGSTIAYQGGGRGLGLDYVQQLCESVCQGVEPQLTLLLDIAPEEGLRRRCLASAAPDRFEAEALSFHQRVREAFLALAANPAAHWLALDATEAPSLLAARALGAISAL